MRPDVKNDIRSCLFYIVISSFLVTCLSAARFVFRILFYSSSMVAGGLPVQS